MDTVGDREEGTLVAQWLEGTVVGRSGEIACTVLKQYILCTCRLRDPAARTHWKCTTRKVFRVAT